MSRFLIFLGRHAMTAMVAGVFIGLLVPPLATLLRPMLAAAVWALLVISLLRVDLAQGVMHLGRPFRLLVILVLFMVAMPVGMQALTSVTDLPPGVAGAMVLTAGSSVLISTPTIGLLMGLDGAMILLIMLGSTLLVPLTMPSVALLLLGMQLDVSTWELMGRLAALVGSGVLVAVICRRIWAPQVARISRQLDGGAVIVLIIFALAIMDGMTARLLANPAFVLFVTAISFAVYTGLLIATVGVLAIITPRWGRKVILSVGLSAGCRNLGVILAVLPTGSDPDMLLYFAAGQFPIYIMPAVLRPVMLRLVAKKPI